jgi:hypothetical protein
MIATPVEFLAILAAIFGICIVADKLEWWD